MTSYFYDNITFQISANIYWGFQLKIRKSLVKELIKETNDKLIKYIKDDMKYFFKNNNLLELSEGIDNLKLHFHCNVNEILDSNNIIYVCDHCH